MTLRRRASYCSLIALFSGGRRRRGLPWPHDIKELADEAEGVHLVVVHAGREAKQFSLELAALPARPALGKLVAVPGGVKVDQPDEIRRLAGRARKGLNGRKAEQYIRCANAFKYHSGSGFL